MPLQETPKISTFRTNFAVLENSQRFTATKQWIKKLKPWLGDSIGWSVIPYTKKRLWVQLPVRAHTWVGDFIPFGWVWQVTDQCFPLNWCISLSLKHILGVKNKKKERKGKTELEASHFLIVFFLTWDKLLIFCYELWFLFWFIVLIHYQINDVLS